MSDLFTLLTGGVETFTVAVEKASESAAAIFESRLDYSKNTSQHATDLIMGMYAEKPPVASGLLEGLDKNKKDSGLAPLDELFSTIGENKTQKGMKALDKGMNTFIGGGLKAKAVGAAWEFVNNAIAPLLTPLQTFASLGSILSIMFIPISTEINKFLVSLIPYITQFAQFMQPILTFLFHTISPLGILLDKGQTLIPILQGIGNWLGNAGNTIHDFFVNLGSKSKDAIVGGWNTVTMFFSTLGENSLMWIRNGWNSFTMFFTNMGQDVVYRIRSQWNSVTGFFDGVWDNIVTTLRNNVYKVTDWFAALPQMIVNTITSAGNIIKDAIWNWFVGLFT
jgi:hypothetical protein